MRFYLPSHENKNRDNHVNRNFDDETDKRQEKKAKCTK